MYNLSNVTILLIFQVSEDLDWTVKPVIGRVEAVDMDEGLNSILHFSGNFEFLEALK